MGRFQRRELYPHGFQRQRFQKHFKSFYNQWPVSNGLTHMHHSFHNNHYGYKHDWYRLKNIMYIYNCNCYACYHPKPRWNV